MASGKQRFRRDENIVAVPLQRGRELGIAHVREHLAQRLHLGDGHELELDREQHEAREARVEVRAVAEREILARPEGFKLGSTTVVDDGRLQRSIYCARTGAGWALASLTVPGPKPVSRTRALSSTVYLRSTPSPLCASGD